MHDAAHRLPHVSPMRVSSQLSSGFLSAPLRHATIAFMHPVGLASLKAWDSGITEAAVKMMAAEAQVRGWLVPGMAEWLEQGSASPM